MCTSLLAKIINKNASLIVLILLYSFCYTCASKWSI